MEMSGCIMVNKDQQHQRSTHHPSPLIGKCHASLGWADIKLGAAGAERLAQALERNSTLTSFNLSCDVQKGREMEVGGFVVVNEHQQHHSSIHHPPPLTGEGYALLGGADNNVGAAGAERLVQALERNSTLTLLHLSCMCNVMM